MTCLEVGFEMADRQSVGEYAAFVAEPVQGPVVWLYPGKLF